MAQQMDFEQLVNQHYLPLYRFAFSLTRRESDASDLTQQTFYIWAKKGYQLNNTGKVKSWLFTTLHREYLQQRRRLTRFPDVEVSSAESELPEIPPTPVAKLDGMAITKALAQLDPAFRAPVALFYLEDYSYAEIGEIMEIPLGTVKSRISRGITQLQQLLVEAEASTARKVSGE